MVTLPGSMPGRSDQSAPPMGHSKKQESSRRVVYQYEEMRRKARRRRMRDGKRNLPADKKNSSENGDDSHPLPARYAFLEEDGRKTDGDRSVQRAKDGDHRDLLHFHSEIAEHKRAGIQGAHAQNHPAHLAAR